MTEHKPHSELLDRAAKEPLGADISDYSDEWCAGFLAGQVNALEASGLLEQMEAAEQERDRFRSLVAQWEWATGPGGKWTPTELVEDQVARLRAVATDVRLRDAETVGMIFDHSREALEAAYAELERAEEHHAWHHEQEGREVEEDDERLRVLMVIAEALEELPEPLTNAPAAAVVIRYGCHECLRGHDESSTDVVACPHCGGLTEPMPADEQPTIEARRAVAWAASNPASHPQLEDNADPMWESGDARAAGADPAREPK